MHRRGSPWRLPVAPVSEAIVPRQPLLLDVFLVVVDRLSKDSPKISRDAACKGFDDWADYGGPSRSGSSKSPDTSVGCPNRWSCNPVPLKEEPISYGLRTVQWEGPPAIPAGADVGGLLGKWARSIWKSHIGTGHLVSGLAAAPETLSGLLTRARKGLGWVSHRAGLGGCNLPRYPRT